MPQKDHRSDCPLNYALEVFGDRWTLLLVRDMLFKGKRSYSEFLCSEESIATNLLADRLRKLEHHEIVIRRRNPDNARKVLYELTDKGLALTPLLLDMLCWAADYAEDCPEAAKFIERARTDRMGLAAELVNEAKSRRGAHENEPSHA